MRKPAGELNARSRVGIGGSVCANFPDRGPGRVAGSELVSKCRMVGTVTGVERPTPRVNLTADRFRRVGARIVLLVGGVPIRGWASPRTGSGVPRAGPLIIRSQTGVARRAAGVIRNLR